MCKSETEYTVILQKQQNKAREEVINREEMETEWKEVKGRKAKTVLKKEDLG